MGKLCLPRFQMEGVRYAPFPMAKKRCANGVGQTRNGIDAIAYCEEPRTMIVPRLLPRVSL